MHRLGVEFVVFVELFVEFIQRDRAHGDALFKMNSVHYFGVKIEKRMLSRYRPNDDADSLPLVSNHGLKKLP